ncbi:hypothetical protein FACS1894116_08150 [Betaproteobacteria bacterium]|nr:hypothetical protein FACS1894116_08150 [Betaproteobacteria bacterium]
MTDPTGATHYRYQQIGAAGGNNTVQLSYDPLGRIIQTKNTQLGTFKYSYLGDTPQLTVVPRGGLQAVEGVVGVRPRFALAGGGFSKTHDQVFRGGLVSIAARRARVEDV